MALTSWPTVCLPLFAFFALHSQTIEVSPSRVMIDQSASILATGLKPNERVAIRAELVDGADAHWTSQAEFVADAQGAIDTSRQPAVAGSYKEVSSMGLMWSMMPSDHKTARYQPPRNFGPQTVEFRLMRGNAQLAVASMQQIPIAEGVERVTVHDGALRGTLFLPPGKDRHPVVLVLGGSEGGMPTRRAAWLASRGYAALALAYFRFDDLPKELAGIPLEYFGQALNWMSHRPEIASDRIAVMGVSRGAELALQLGSMYPVIKAVVAYSPSNARNPACCGVHAGALCLDVERRRARVSSRALHAQSVSGDAGSDRSSDDGRPDTSDFRRLRSRLAFIVHGGFDRRSPQAVSFHSQLRTLEVSSCRPCRGPAGNRSCVAGNDDESDVRPGGGNGRHAEGHRGVVTGRNSECD